MKRRFGAVPLLAQRGISLFSPHWTVSRPGVHREGVTREGGQFGSPTIAAIRACRSYLSCSGKLLLLKMCLHSRERSGSGDTVIHSPARPDDSTTCCRHLPPPAATWCHLVPAQVKLNASMSKTTVTSSGRGVRANTAWMWRVKGRARCERRMIWNRYCPWARCNGDGSTSPNRIPG